MSEAAHEDNEPYDTINITPMLDLAYVLLIMFIILTTATVQGIMVNLPKASAAPSLAKPKTKAITIDAQGNVFLDTYPVTMAELEQRLRQLKAVTPDLPLVIKGDAKIQYEKVIDVLDIAGRLEITQIGLVTQKIVK
jgi:biopolymer transport protein ExbD